MAVLRQRGKGDRGGGIFLRPQQQQLRQRQATANTWKPSLSQQQHYNNKRSRIEMEDNTDTRSFTSEESSSPSTPPNNTAMTLSMFCSPPEPLFNQKGSSLLLQESLHALSNDISTSHNQFFIKGGSTSDKCQGVYRTGEPVAYFMYMSSYFKLPPDIQYRAIELFHRFMSRHVCELYDHVQLSKSSPQPINWDTVEERLTHQVTLRALSCLQLASKLSLHYKIISLTKARNFLANCGFRYASSSLVQSEIRVLKTLDYHVHGPTPLDFIEVLLEALGHNCSSLPIKQLYGVSIKLLDTYYLSTPVIMEKLKQISKEPSVHCDTSSAFESINFLLLAAGIIGASSYLLDDTKSDEVIGTVAKISQISSEDILDISALLVEHIMTD